MSKTSFTGLAASAIPPKWSWHYRTLLAHRQRLLAQEVQHLHDAMAPLPAEVADAGERGETVSEQNFADALLKREPQALAQVDAAIRRLENGTYGICQITGLPIPAARLRAVPWAAHVRDVAATREARALDHERPTV